MTRPSAERPDATGRGTAERADGGRAIGLVGLGRMGLGMAARWRAAGVRVVGTDAAPAAREGAAASGLEVAEDAAAVARALAPPRVVWIMVPAGDPVDAVLDALRPALEAGDLVVDGGNSHYRDSQRRAAELAGAGVRFCDVGVSGGIAGREAGYCLMMGGAPEDAARLRPFLEALAPAPDRGIVHAGPVGAGHFAKMVHNGIEYGMMQALAEGFALLDARRDLVPDPAAVAEAWRYGSVIRSWLLDLAAAILREDARLDAVEPWVADSGEGRWALAEAIDRDVPTPALAVSLLARLRSRSERAFSDRLLAALRARFGGHPVRGRGG